MKFCEKLVETFLDWIFDKIFGPTPSLGTDITLDAPKFFEKLIENRKTLYILKDPYNLAFSPNLLFRFYVGDTTYYSLISPDGKVWSRLRYEFPEKTIFPSGNQNFPWVQKIPWENIEKALEIGK